MTKTLGYSVLRLKFPIVPKFIENIGVEESNFVLLLPFDTLLEAFLPLLSMKY
jgi:hypothetical protein